MDDEREDVNDSEQPTRPARRTERTSRRSSASDDERRPRRAAGDEERKPRRSSDDTRRPRRAAGEGGDDQAQDQRKRGGLSARDAGRRAVEELDALTQNPLESVVGVERDDDGWKVTIEVLEDAHIPSTSDILAEYEVRLSADGELIGYSRGRRYVRGRAEA